MNDDRIDAILRFWFGDGAPPPFRAQWWAKDAAFDDEIRARFAGHRLAAITGALDAWEETPRGALALVILIDQFSRNLFRGSPEAWANDAQALRICDRAIARGLDAKLVGSERLFLYMPTMHSEDIEVQNRSVALFEALGRELGEPFTNNAEYARRHRDIVARFGRFPHRNAILGRESSAEEAAFLLEPGSSF